MNKIKLRPFTRLENDCYGHMDGCDCDAKNYYIVYLQIKSMELEEETFYGEDTFGEVTEYRKNFKAKNKRIVLNIDGRIRTKKIVLCCTKEAYEPFSHDIYYIVDAFYEKKFEEKSDLNKYIKELLKIKPIKII